MTYPVLQSEEVSLSEDPRWQLVGRIVASQAFAKSDRLCTFLFHICELALTGREDEINEISIGIRLFGRPNFDPSIDGIVRSHASRMRQRLDQYFEEDGSAESIRLIIPKGAYVPVFETRPVFPNAEPQAELQEPELPIANPPAVTAQNPSRPHRTIQILSMALLLASIIIVWLIVNLHHRTADPAERIEKHPLWAMLFGGGRHATVVCSDTGVAVLQDLTGQQVSLSGYLNDDYRTNTSVPVGTTSDVLRELAARRYTAIADVGILLRFYNLPGIGPDRIQFRYARDLSPDAIKDGTTVLIGSAYSDPWVRPFESHMNFVFRDDPLRRGSFIINHHQNRANCQSTTIAGPIPRRESMVSLLCNPTSGDLGMSLSLKARPWLGPRRRLTSCLMTLSFCHFSPKSLTRMARSLISKSCCSPPASMEAHHNFRFWAIASIRTEGRIDANVLHGSAALPPLQFWIVGRTPRGFGCGSENPSTGPFTNVIR